MGGALEPVLSSTKPRNGYFLRAESFFKVASFVDGGTKHAPDLSLYGDIPQQQQSHGQAFLALAANRFGGEGFYVLDEPEAALSISGALALLAVVVRATQAGAQFVIATHSPILLACPDARIYELDETGLARCQYDALDAVRLTRAFLDAPDRFVHAALEDLGAGLTPTPNSSRFTSSRDAGRLIIRWHRSSRREEHEPSCPDCVTGRGDARRRGDCQRGRGSEARRLTSLDGATSPGRIGRTRRDGDHLRRGGIPAPI